MGKGEFVPPNLEELAKDMSQNSRVSYSDLPRYDLFLSQVVDYLKDKFPEENYTNNIIQNYIKNEIITKPEDGRKKGYTKLHLIQLTLLSYMRPVLNTEEIRKVFKLAFNEINDRSDDIISWEMAYKIFADIQQQTIDDFISKKYFNEEALREIVSNTNLKEEDEEKIFLFLSVINLIATASVIKKFAKSIIEKYEKNK